jgi:hypothetical protein
MFRKNRLFILLCLPAFLLMMPERAGALQPRPQMPETTASSNVVSRAKLLTIKKIYVTLGEDFVFDIKFKVLEYTFVMVPKSGNAYIEKASGSDVTQTMYAKMQTAKPGDLIIISEVKVSDPDGKVQILDGKTMTVR